MTSLERNLGGSVLFCVVVIAIAFSLWGKALGQRDRERESVKRLKGEVTALRTQRAVGKTVPIAFDLRAKCEDGSWVTLVSRTPSYETEEEAE